MAPDITNEANDGPEDVQPRPTRQNADRAMSETCPESDAARRTGSGQQYSAPECAEDHHRTTPTLRPRVRRTVQFDPEVAVGEASANADTTLTDPRSHLFQLEPRDMTLTLVGNNDNLH